MAIPQIVPYDYFYQWRDKTNLIATLMGDIALINVAAGDRDSFVEAINKVISNIGSLTLLSTTDKDSIVDAINETGDKIGTLAALTTTSNSSLVVAINELDGDIGPLSSLLTTDKDSAVDGINEVFKMHLITNCTFTIGTEASDVIRVTVQLKNSEGNNLAFRANVFAYLSDNIDGSTLIATAHSGGWVIGTAGLLINQVTNKAANFTTNATGAFNVDITETSGKTAYLVVVLPNGKNIVSSAITHAA